MKTKLAIALGALTFGGCFLTGTTPAVDAGPDPMVATDSGPPPPPRTNPTEEDIAEYNRVTEELDASRDPEPFLSEIAGETAAVHDYLFWQEFRSFDPSLHSYYSPTGQRVDYTFPIGSGDFANYRASTNMIVNAERSGDRIIYRAYAVGEANTPLGELTMAAPGGEARWWAYAVDGTTLYVVTTGTETVLNRWVPGGALERVLGLEAAGMSVGEFWEFGVEGDRMIAVESGRVWSIDIALGTATWLMAEHEATGRISFNAWAVLMPTASGPLYHDLETGAVLHLSTEIEESGYQLNSTFAAAHHYLRDATLFERSVIYIGSSGVFRYDLDTGLVDPILLEPRNPELRIVYVRPAVLDDGSLFVTGLESTSGAVGADGPIWRVAL